MIICIQHTRKWNFIKFSTYEKLSLKHSYRFFVSVVLIGLRLDLCIDRPTNINEKNENSIWPKLWSEFPKKNTSTYSPNILLSGSITQVFGTEQWFISNINKMQWLFVHHCLRYPAQVTFVLIGTNPIFRLPLTLHGNVDKTTIQYVLCKERGRDRGRGRRRWEISLATLMHSVASSFVPSDEHFGQPNVTNFPDFQIGSVAARYCRNQNHIHTMAKFGTKLNGRENEAKRKRERKRSQKSIGIVFHLFFAHSIPLECGRQVLLLAQLTSLFIFLLRQIMKLDCTLRLTWKGKTRIKWPIL